MQTAELTVIIQGLTVHTRVGVSSEERAYPQRVVLDLHVRCNQQRDHLPPQRADEGRQHQESFQGDLSRTISYSVLKSEVEQLLKSNEWALLEDMGEGVASLIFQNHSTAIEVFVTLKKFIVQGTDWTGVSIRQLRE